MERNGTLAKLAANPCLVAKPLTVKSSDMAKVLLAADKNSNPKLPDSEAVRFYALNQMVSQIKAAFTLNEVLPPWAEDIVELYGKELIAQARRLMWYTFMITTREFRHLPSPSSTLANSAYPKSLATFLKHVSDSTSESTLNSWLSAMPAYPLGDYCGYLTLQFNTGHYSGGYGGKPWGLISNSLQKFAEGQTSAEVFVDTAYTLAHNNGPMFNKGMLYKTYTGNFKTLLDIQRSGQICEGLIGGEIAEMGLAVDDAIILRGMALRVQQALGGIGEYIDWYKVDTAGALGDYSLQKLQQDKKHGKMNKKKIIEGVPVKVTGTMEIFPGQKVEIVVRLAA